MGLIIYTFLLFAEECGFKIFLLFFVLDDDDDDISSMVIWDREGPTVVLDEVFDSDS